MIDIGKENLGVKSGRSIICEAAKVIRGTKGNHAENSVVSKRPDLESLDEEADINIIKKYVACIKDEVNCGDTDVFVLLTVYVFRQGCKLKVLTEAFDASRSLNDINETAKKHAEIVPSITDDLAISCYDSVSKLHGIRK